VHYRRLVATWHEFPKAVQHKLLELIKSDILERIGPKKIPSITIRQHPYRIRKEDGNEILAMEVRNRSWLSLEVNDQPSQLRQASGNAITEKLIPSTRAVSELHFSSPSQSEDNTSLEYNMNEVNDDDDRDLLEEREYTDSGSENNMDDSEEIQNANCDDSESELREESKMSSQRRKRVRVD
jgi:hypothetical protein